MEKMMGRRGPPPKPTSIKKWEGNLGKRPLNELEPQPRKDTPRCPVWLSAEAKKVWKRMVPELRRMKVLTHVDGDALAAYCQTYARWKAAEEFLAKHGDVYPLRDDQGRVRYMQQFPHVAIARSLLQILRAYQQEFGLTPSARSRIEVDPHDRPSKLELFRLRYMKMEGRFEEPE
jgi:P27 family predicted phage terminase small subunit